jgi:voltage-gated potassium channel Kch
MLATLRLHFGRILLGAGLVVAVLGFIGFRTCNPALTADQSLYRTLRLFYWDYSPWDGAKEMILPWTLVAAMWLAPLVLMGAIFGVAISLLERRFMAWKARRISGHTIICGGGSKGRVLAENLQERKLPFVVVERDRERVDLLIADGLTAVCGDASETAVLARTGIRRALRLVSLTGDDHDNLAIAVAAAQAVEGSDPAPSLAIYLHCSDPALCALYQRNRALQDGFGGLPVRVFNQFRNMARRCLQEFPPSPGTGVAHVVLPSLSPLGFALVVEYAMVGHYPGDRGAHVHLVGPRAIAEVARLRSLYPAIDQCVVLNTMDLPESSQFAAKVAELVAQFPEHDVFTVYPGIDDDHEAFAHALELNEHLHDRPGLRILLDTPPGAPVRRLVEQNSTLKNRISFLPAGVITGGYEAIISDTLDRTARHIHDKWLEETRWQIDAARTRGDEAAARQHEAKATFRPWEELTEEQKGASRSQADHIPFKIRAAGLDPSTVTPAIWSRLSDADVETLSRMEHARWSAYLWMTGWKYAPQRDDSRKLHPNLVPYDQLDEPTKDYDRAAIRHLGLYLISNNPNP